MEERISWIQNGTNYKRVEGNVSNVDTIPKGIYNIGLSMTGWYLEYTGKEFLFDYKVYGLQQDFIDHVMIAYENTKGNFGILLNGTKGTGKTVSAKVLANKLNLPTIIVKSFGENNNNLIEFLASFNFDCIFFFDEFEKNFNERDSSILQIMDGVYTSKYRRIFLLTTNETTINDNLISRPSRLRYIHEFGNLEPNVISELLDDTLKDKSCKDELMSFIDTLEISTIDILKAIVEEVNIFGFKKFAETKKFFNIKTASYNYRSKRIGVGTRERLKEWTIDWFLANIKTSENLKKPMSYDYSSEKEYRLAEDKWRQEYNKLIPPEYCCLTNIPKAFKNLKPKDSFGKYADEIIVAIDVEKKVVLTYATEDECYSYYFIENPNLKPSLYSMNTFTNPYI